MDILVIAGFLGAGKSSFIKELTRVCRRRFVLLENEFGALNLDGPLLARHTPGDVPEMTVRELTEGCICCSVNQDFRHSVLTIANSLDPDILLVEPSGVAKLSRLIESLKKICYERIRLLPPVLLIDGQNYAHFRRHFRDDFEDQVRHAGRLVVSKSEEMSGTDWERFCADLSLAETSLYAKEHYSRWSLSKWETLLLLPQAMPTDKNPSSAPLPNEKKSLHGHDTGGESVHPHPESSLSSLQQWSRLGCRFAHLSELVSRLHILMSGVLGEIFRAKAYLPVGTEYLRFDFVDGRYQICACPPMSDSRLVVIGKNLNREALALLWGGEPVSSARPASSHESEADPAHNPAQETAAT